MAVAVPSCWVVSLHGSAARRDAILADRFTEIGAVFLRCGVTKAHFSWQRTQYTLHFCQPDETPGDDGARREYRLHCQDRDRLALWTGDPYTLAATLYDHRRAVLEREWRVQGYREREEAARDAYGRAVAYRAAFVLGGHTWVGPHADGATGRSAIARALRESQYQQYAHLKERIAATQAQIDQVKAILGPPPLREG